MRISFNIIIWANSIHPNGMSNGGILCTVGVMKMSTSVRHT